MSSRKTRLVHVRLDDDLFGRLTLIAQANDLQLSGLIRSALRRWVLNPVLLADELPQEQPTEIERYTKAEQRQMQDAIDKWDRKRLMSTARASESSRWSMASRTGSISVWCCARLASRKPSTLRRQRLALSCFLRTPLVAARCCRACVTTSRRNSSVRNGKISLQALESWSGVVLVS